jgi:ATP-dependent Clp protease ATP-binding subunit ClpA
LQKSKDIKLNISKPLRDHLAKKGFDPDLGARPLKRVIQRLILDPLSLQIISGELKHTSSVSVDIKGEKVTFEHQQTRKRKSK